MAKKSRVFLRGMSSEQYGLKEFRKAQLEAPRVRNDDVVVDDAKVGHSGASKDSRTWWRIGPGDDPFLTQNIQVHFVEIPAGKSNHGHGHQNEAVFYILQGKGYEIHDDQRYDWEQGDLVVVHTDSVHRHFNDGDETAKALVMKAKSTWMYFGLIQQGRSGPIEDEGRFGPREEWGRVWTPGVEERKKVVKPADTVWETTRDGRIRVLCSKDTPDVRVFSVDVYEQEIPPGSRSGRQLHPGALVHYFLAGQGYSMVDGQRYDWAAGDCLALPSRFYGTEYQHFNASGTEPARFVAMTPNILDVLGADGGSRLEQLEVAPEYARLHGSR